MLGRVWLLRKLDMGTAFKVGCYYLHKFNFHFDKPQLYKKPRGTDEEAKRPGLCCGTEEN